MRRIIIPAVLIAALTGMSFISNNVSEEEDSLHRLVEENAAALGNVRAVDGGFMIVDTIICYSAATSIDKLKFWQRVQGPVYVDCSTCTKQRGRPLQEFAGKCISVRFVADGAEDNHEEK